MHHDISIFSGLKKHTRVVPLLFAIASASTAASVTQTYQYDALGRLTVVTESTGSNQQFGYDAAGNRATQTANAPAPTIYTDTRTMTQGSSICSPTPCPNAIYGYSSGVTGSMSSTSLSGGKSLTGLYDRKLYHNYYTQSFLQTEFKVSGFSSDPGKTWLTSVNAFSQTRTGDAAQYSYVSGVATWIWTGTPIGFTGSGTTSITIIHK